MSVLDASKGTKGIEVGFVWGPQETGKTSAVLKMFEAKGIFRPARFGLDDNFWGGYKGQETILFEDAPKKFLAERLPTIVKCVEDDIIRLDIKPRRFIIVANSHYNTWGSGLFILDGYWAEFEACITHELHFKRAVV